MINRIFISTRTRIILIVKNNKLLFRLYTLFFQLFNGQRHHKEVNERKFESIFNIEKLSKPIVFYPHSPIKDSNFYGVYKDLLEYSLLMNIDSSIEHGLYLGSYVPKASMTSTVKSIITFSKNREIHLKNHGFSKPIYTIGPYIHYAKDLYSVNQVRQEKKKWGKILLVFPSHSIKGMYSEFNIAEFINEISKRSVGFDTTFICLYYEDILKNNFVEDYKNAGFKIVTAGHKYDTYFLRRLKYIINLSDFTLSNAVGTHIGYCIYLNKPHLLIHQKITHHYTSDRSIGEFRNKRQTRDLYRENEIIREAFMEESQDITSNQLKVANYFWGFDQIKTRGELNELLKSTKH